MMLSLVQKHNKLAAPLYTYKHTYIYKAVLDQKYICRRVYIHTNTHKRINIWRDKQEGQCRVVKNLLPTWLHVQLYFAGDGAGPLKSIPLLFDVFVALFVWFQTCLQLHRDVMCCGLVSFQPALFFSRCKRGSFTNMLLIQRLCFSRFQDRIINASFNTLIKQHLE